MSCPHTGLPQNMCGHCNGTHPLAVEPFGGMRPDDEPRLLHGKWVGKGQSTGGLAINPVKLHAALIGSSIHIHAPRSQWAMDNMLRSLAGAARHVSPEAIRALARVKLPANQPSVGKPAVVDSNRVWVPIEADAEVTRKSPPTKWNVKPPTQTIKHARSAGATTRRQGARERV